MNSLQLLNISISILVADVIFHLRICHIIGA